MKEQTSWLSDAPLVIAHRGASLLAPENTIAAFERAADLHADAIEFDVKLTSDGVPVVHHDQTLERTTDGKGRLKDYPLRTLRELDAGYKFGTKFRGEKIPLLDEVIDRFHDRMLLNIEITNYNDIFDDLAERVLTCFHEAVDKSRILVSSFNPIALRTMKRLDPDVRTALLLGRNVPNLIRRLLRSVTPHDDLHPQHQIVTKKLVETYSNTKRCVNVWTVNEYDHMVNLFKIGVHGIITDDVELALRARDQGLH